MRESLVVGDWVVTRRLSDADLPEPGVAATGTVDGEQISGTLGVTRIDGRIEEDRPRGPFAVTGVARPSDAVAQEDALPSHLGEAERLEPGMMATLGGLTTVEYRRSATDESPRLY